MTQQTRLVYVDICVQCGSATENTTTTLKYEVNGLSIAIENVPASVCPNCGEKYVPGDVGLAINKRVKRLADFARENSVAQGSLVLTADSFELSERETIT